MLRVEGRSMRAQIISGLASLIAVGGALAADDPVAQRRAIIQACVRAESSANQLILGKFNAAKAVKTMKTLQEKLTAFPNLLPEGSLTGETHASQEIWSHMDDFKAHAAALVSDAKDAEMAAGNGQDAFNIAWQKVRQDCSG